jgi:hypothetical protein
MHGGGDATAMSVANAVLSLIAVAALMVLWLA